MQKSDVAGRARPSETSTASAVTKLNEIIERLEKATGPDRELDDKIWRAANDGQWLFKGWLYDLEEPPTFTSSVDAALTLVPEGWASASISEKRRGSIGYVHNNEPAFAGIFAKPNPNKRWFEVRHSVRAIALCIAALRARASRDTPSSPEETEASQAKPPQNTVED